MAKQIMIRDDIAAELDKIREERSCSYSAVIDELISERDKNAPERANDFFTAAAAFEESVNEYNRYIRKGKPVCESDYASLLKNEKAMSGVKKAIKNYIICTDLFGYITDKDVQERTKEISDFLIYEVCFFYDCEHFTSGAPEIIFSPTMKKRIEATNEEVNEYSKTDEFKENLKKLGKEDLLTEEEFSLSMP